jgi:hypothetical protein
MKREDYQHLGTGEIKELEWTTFYGGRIPLSKISHQHLSNILWYYELVVDFITPTPHIQEELEKRFGGIRLPYSPLLSFPEEIEALVLKGYTTGFPDADVIVNSQWVGKIKYT